MAKYTRVQRRLPQAPPRRRQLPEQEVRADALDEGDRGEVCGVEVVDEVSGRELGVEDAAGAVDGDEGAEDEDGKHECPEEHAEDAEVAAVHYAGKDGVAVEDVSSFLDLSGVSYISAHLPQGMARYSEDSPSTSCRQTPTRRPC